ncbi:hypothetical protein QX226_05805 [Vibrio vulnificus]|uniref:hypothetical protein n=1 Tax=Vibrio vulnificus TaxID=672 RepID=UPI001A2B53A2|nr:hypothetical protein [Vibrio vulnificus]EGR0109966.1 hypothetical protein [Vibrio vulnificus]EIF5018704.1 hypothetical protein [Vibrio vulnificus]EIO2321338.1 hypothetical protein [Vibrio vulnificus]EIO4066854.1 hypothetical protein [Vibrio vulnificus]ELE2039559.1 hypothetical protein [Vibrio vulnificus]
MTRIKASDVYTPSHYPEHTLVLRKNDYTEDIRDAIEDRRLVSIAGPSKSGKTVLVESAIGHSRLIEVTGGGIKKAEDVWNKVLDQIGTPNSRTVTKSNTGTKSNVFNAGVTVGAGPVKATGGGSSTEQEQNGSQKAETFTRDPLNLVIDNLSKSDNVIFIDDFHYIPLDVQKIIAQQIKELVRKEISVVYASVPYHSDDIIRANSDLQGRIFKIDLSYWETAELEQIAHRGFDILNFSCKQTQVQELVAEAAGSPQLMQSLCLQLCRTMQARNGVDPAEPPRDITPTPQKLNEVCVKVSKTTDYENLISKLLEGAPTRGKDRKLYALKDGSNGDVYKVTLKALKQNPALMIIRYNALYERVKSICVDVPQSTGIVQACTKISEISGKHINATDESKSNMLIEFDTEDSVISFRDPYLLYALRWSNEF